MLAVVAGVAVAGARLTHGVVTLTPATVLAGAQYEVAGCGFDPRYATVVCEPFDYYTYCNFPVTLDANGCFDELYFYAPYASGRYKVDVKQGQPGHAYAQTVGTATLTVP